jgi:hypothetical protein
MVAKIKQKFINNFLNQKGQALFEMILFLPFLMFLYTIYYSVGNSINGSINQQKAVRGYFYSRVKGNSYLVSLSELVKFKEENSITKVGFNSLGWADQMKNEKNPLAPCFKFSSLIKNNSTEECNGSERDNEHSSKFIRLFTYYGVCGATYTPGRVDGNSFEIEPKYQSSSDSCTLR